MQFPDAPGDAIVIAKGGVISLQSASDPATIMWEREIAAGATVTRLGLVPDLDGDLTREVRALVELEMDGDRRATEAVEETWVLSGARGDVLLILDESASFDPWADDPADVNHDGEVTYEDDLGTLLSLRDRLRLLPTFSRWYEFKNSESRSNEATVRTRRARRDDPGVAAGHPTTGPAQLWEVEFSGSHEVRKDYDTANPPTPPTAPPPPEYLPKWFDEELDGTADDWSGGDIRAPIAYTAGDSVEIESVVMYVSPAGDIDLLDDPQLVGYVGGVKKFSSTTFAYNQWQNELTATNISSTATSTASVIDFREDWTIEWKIEYPRGGPDPVDVGTSKNHLYFVLADPTGEFHLYYSVLDIGVRRADGLNGSDHGAIADAIFEEFTNGQGDGPGTVHRRTDVLEGIDPPHQLTYYEDWTCNVSGLQEFLAFGDGQCHAWFLLFVRSLHAVGIDPVDERVKMTIPHPSPIWGGESAIFINDWTIPGQGTGNNPHPSKTQYEFINFANDPLRQNNSYSWDHNDVQEAAGIPGQGTTNPDSFFNEHYIAGVGDDFYDVSYGKTYATVAEFEADAVAAFVIDFRVNPPTIDEVAPGIDFNQDGQLTAITQRFIVIKKNPSGYQMDAETSDVDR